MNFQVKAFQTSKYGVPLEECEDAFEVVAEKNSLCLSLSDGASESFLSRLWAKALTQSFVHNRPQFSDLKDDKAGLLNWLGQPLEQYNAAIDWDSLRWNQVAKAERGDPATLLGVVFGPPTDSSMDALQEDDAFFPCPWSALAVGDTCLFHVRQNQLLSSFPLHSASEFDISPDLLSTRRSNRDVVESLQLFEGTCEVGDLFLAATDALSHWIFLREEANESPWPLLLQLTADNFQAFVDHIREVEGVRNDDMTLVVIEGADDHMNSPTG